MVQSSYPNTSQLVWFSSLLILIQNFEEGMLHENVVELLELLEGVLEMLGGALCQDIHLKVGVGNLFFVVLLVWCRILLPLALQGLLRQVRSHRVIRSLRAKRSNF
jgi:hypothetical protein